MDFTLKRKEIDENLETNIERTKQNEEIRRENKNGKIKSTLDNLLKDRLTVGFTAKSMKTIKPTNKAAKLDYHDFG